MRILITIQHPAHVHFFRNIYKKLSQSGHDVRVFARIKPLVPELLDIYDINHKILAGKPSTKWSLPIVQAKYEWNLYRAARRISPDVMMAIGEPGVAHVGKMTGATSILFTDTEHAQLQKRISIPFADYVYTPSSFTDDLGPHHRRHPSLHELAYLHPNQFEPNSAVLHDIGLRKDERFIILRLVEWEALHDIGGSGFDNINDVVDSLEEMGVRVFITAEGEIPKSVESRKVTVEPHRIHDLMYYADLFIGESGTMAAESAILGTPSIFVSSLQLGYLDELEDRYGLVFNYSGEDRQTKALERAITILDTYNKSKWEQKRNTVLENKVDMTAFVLKQILGVKT